MNRWQVFLIGLIIVLVSNIFLSLINSLLKNIPDNVLVSISISLGLAYIVSYNVEIKDSNVSLKMQRIVNYLFSAIIIFIIIIGFSFLIDIIF